MPGLTMVLVAHPVQLLDDAELVALADQAFVRVLQQLQLPRLDGNETLVR